MKDVKIASMLLASGLGLLSTYAYIAPNWGKIRVKMMTGHVIACLIH